jgi:glycosyltransferase involved in cell wall biosynthesis
MVDNIKITAILPNYNSSEFLLKSVQSLINQTEPFAEIIIIDDGSTDASLAIIHSLMEGHANIRLIQHEKNQGVCQSLNDGVEAAIGDYVLFCAADDWYAENMVALAKQVIRKHPAIGLIGGDAWVYRFDQSSSFKRTLSFTQKNTYLSPNDFRAVVRQGYVGFNGGGLFINRRAILAAGLMYPQLRWCCDWMLHFVIAFRLGFYYIDEVFVHVLLRKASYSEGKHRWGDQKKIILSTLKIMSEDYPELWKDFKEAALLPGYGMRYLSLYFNPLARRFFTLRLIWRFMINNALVIRVGRLFPYRVIARARKLLWA